MMMRSLMAYAHKHMGIASNRGKGAKTCDSIALAATLSGAIDPRCVASGRCEMDVQVSRLRQPQ
jgi:hypothetical protein